MNRKKLNALCVLAFLLAGLSVTAQNEIAIKPLSGELNFDGQVSEPEWKLSQDFQMMMHYPVYNNTPTEKSEVYITFDDTYLWIGAVLHYNDINNVVSTSKKRDEVSENSDAFGIVLDSYNDNENGLAFFTMPSGLKIDYAISNDGQGGGPGPGGSKNYTWNSYWDVKTVTTENAWHVEMRIPFSSLRFQSVNDITKMGLIINRNISHRNEIATYPAIDTKYGRDANLRPSLSQTIVFEGIKSRNPVYISPYVLGGTSKNYELNENGTEYVSNNDPEFTGGLDVKYNLNNNLTLDFTVNTDFAQVEADDEMVNLTRYSLFFPEKRLFFQERSGVFSFDLGGPQDLFYSRNIGISPQGDVVDILGGARLVGRAGKWDIGFLNMNTQKYNGSPAENFGVARLRKQVINENSYVGGIVTSRIDFDGNYNVAYGLDGIFKLTDVDYLDVKIAQTQDKNTDAETMSLDPTYMAIGIERRSEKGIIYQGKYAYWGKSFDPKAGFMFLNNIHETRGQLGYGWFPAEKSPVFNGYLGVDFEMTSRIEDGEIENMEISPEFKMDFKNGYGFFTSLGFKKESLLWDFHLGEEAFVPAGDYTYWNFRGMLFSPRTKKLVTSMGLGLGEFYDGNKFSLELEPELNVSASLQLSATYQLDKIEFSTRNQKFTNNIARVKATYMLNTKVSVSSFVQYNELDNIILTNLRLRYNPRDGNDFYFVFNDLRNADKSGANPKLPKYLSRTVMLKYTHTFRL
ncbi:DUF5916 domain-containing protein [Draconibacterium halophilum]|uniref:Carbohydrate binding family 9 domain-containing protein n=1 Tax=Draconibacterium halophilum TaxID=2706887 RepID=A0A6C0R8Y8_9BACT|nr:DUF5916 domain-containing protein [Draconibacterium halophilum]QIA06567.1 carbohydrate binding family 9 domain-containing protein [Draconibacterium halophilum]